MEPINTPNAVTKAEFARMKGVDRSTITRWADQSRIVVDDGRVLVAESEARLAETADPSKAGVVKRHELERGAPVADLLTVPAPSRHVTRAEKGEHYGARIRESARHEAAKAEMAELELAQRKSQLTDVEGVQKAMADFATLTRQTYERIRPELKLRLAVETDPDRVDQLLRDAIDNAARTVADLLKAQIDAAANTRQ